MELDLRQLVRIARRWWFLLLLAPLLAGGTAYYAASQQTPLYSSSVILRINPPAGNTIDYSTLQVTQNLTETYRQLILMSPILDRVIEELGLPFDDEELAAKLTSTAVPDTQLMSLAVSDPDPDLAALVANTTATVFIEYLSEQTNQQVVGTQELLNQQIQDVQESLAAIRAEIESLDTDANDPGIQSRIDSLQLQETQLLQQQASLQVQAQSLGLGLVSTQAQVTISNPAKAPENPYEPRVTFYTALAVFVGLLLAIGGIILLEYLDNTIHGDSDVQALTSVPLLSSINQIPKLQPGAHQVYTVSDPRGGPAEAVRLLRASLEFAAAAKPINRLAITSAGPTEGKSTVVANLGVAMAQAGYSTIIIDADLRKPTQHKIFNVSNGDGLTTLLTHHGQSWREVANRVAVPNLYLIGSGPIPPNPNDLLSLDRFSALLELLEEDVDIVLIDTPPVLAVSDPLLIASKSDGVVLLSRAGFTRRDRLKQAADALIQSGVRLIGVVINQQTSQTSSYYYYGDYGSSTGKMDQPVFTTGKGEHLSSID